MRSLADLAAKRAPAAAPRRFFFRHSGSARSAGNIRVVARSVPAPVDRRGALAAHNPSLPPFTRPCRPLPRDGGGSPHSPAMRRRAGWNSGECDRCTPRAPRQAAPHATWLSRGAIGAGGRANCTMDRCSGGPYAGWIVPVAIPPRARGRRRQASRLTTLMRYASRTGYASGAPTYRSGGGAAPRCHMQHGGMVE